MSFYTACKADRKPIHNQHDYKVICGSVEYDNELKNQLKNEGFLLDEDGENISDLNWTFADVANIYYAWKNSDDDFIGVNQYKRYWKEDIQPSKNVLYAPKKLLLPVSLINHVKINRETKPEFGVATDTYLDLCFDFFPLNMSSCVLNSREYIAHNMFAAEKPLFDKMCSVLFDHLWPIFDGCKDRIPRKDPYHSRQMGFVSELVIDSILKNSKYFFGDNVSIVEVDIHG